MSDTFARQSTRHRFAARGAHVVATTRPVPGVVRVTLGGPELTDFVSTGPADHVKLYFPDADGVLVAPRETADGIERPTEPTISRDYTPLAVRADAAGQTTLDIDFMLHENPGPATLWADSATVGDSLVVMGPRGSRDAPQDARALLLVCDETSLPSVSRWIDDVPADTSITVIAAADSGWVTAYLGDRTVQVVDATATGLLAAVEAYGAIDSETYVFAAGEAGALVPVRSYLRSITVPQQLTVSGYWRRGTVGFDHHSPIDPTDPD